MDVRIGRDHPRHLGRHPCTDRRDVSRRDPKPRPLSTLHIPRRRVVRRLRRVTLILERVDATEARRQMAKASVAWKVQVHGDGGALGEEQIRKLAEDFAIDLELVRQLSADLARALHPLKGPKSVSDVILRPRKGAAQFEKAVKDMRLAEKKIGEALSGLDRIHLDDLLPEILENDPLIISKLMNRARSNIITVRVMLTKRVKRAGEVRYRGELDKRKTRDHRRSMVCDRIFRIWESAGRELSYTTDLQSKRRGPLVEFVNAVVACVSKPPGSLEGETIRKEIGNFMDFQRLIAEVSRSQKIENQDT